MGQAQQLIYGQLLGGVKVSSTATAVTQAQAHVHVC
jgi:hypothetical protein